MNEKLTLFIGSSSEARDAIATPIVQRLASHFRVVPWWTAFPSGQFTLESLLKQLNKTDLALLVFKKDDHVEMRGEAEEATRDNVVLEYGLFLARLGRERVRIFAERGVKRPSDILGLNNLEFREEEDSGRDADIDFACNSLVGDWGTLRPIRTLKTQIIDHGYGFSEALKLQSRRIQDIIDCLANEKPKAMKFVFDSRIASVDVYCEALNHANFRFWTTTFLKSGFWTGDDEQSAKIIRSNNSMMQRLQKNNKEARRLFLFDKRQEEQASAEHDLRVHLRQQGLESEVKKANLAFKNLVRNMGQIEKKGCELRVIYDEEARHNQILTAFTFDPSNQEIAIYDDFRVDIFHGGRLGVINAVDCYSKVNKNFEIVLEQVEQYFEELWNASTPIDSYLDSIKQQINRAEVRIDYESNWLARYEFALNQEDEALKTVEMKRVEEMLREHNLYGNVQRYLDIGTCTARYPIGLRDAVVPTGEIVGIDDDIDCIRFANALVADRTDGDKRISIIRVNFAGHERRDLQGSFDLITCMLGTLSHFGWNRNEETRDDTLQRALNRTKELLAPKGLLLIGTWSQHACEEARMLGIYRRPDRLRLKKWTPTTEQMSQRLQMAELKVVQKVQPEERLDLWVCAHRSVT